jgi:hypothetical protein
MKCSDLQPDLNLYAAGSTDDAISDSIKMHLEVCPLCRQQYFEFRDVHDRLQHLPKPDISADLRNSIKRNVRSEIYKSQNARLPFSADIREWLVMSVIPYSAGVCASLLVALMFLTMMFSGMLQPGNLPSARSGSGAILLASNRGPYDHDSAEISPTEYAKTRLSVADESPSINPKGALIALTKSLVRGGMKDDEVVVVADIFGNGLAQIAEVVEPSRDRRAVAELQKALDTDPSYAPFVPASFENRPDSVRVILKFENVDVSTNPKGRPKHKSNPL